MLQAMALARRYLALPSEERRYFLRRFVDLKVHHRPGFSQYGEDASVASYLKAIGRSCRNYIDIGANNPVTHSNTYLFYRDGGRGILAEANPKIAKRIRRRRPRDLTLNVAVVSEGSGTIDLHVMDMDGLSTISAGWRKKVESQGAGVPVRVVKIPVLAINDLLRQHCSSGVTDFASLDIEGLDFEVLTAWDFDRWRPYLFCAETTEANTSEFRKDERIAEVMKQRGYRPLFESFANTIFVNERA